MDEAENANGHDDEDIYEAEVVEDDGDVPDDDESSDESPDESSGESPAEEGSADALADMAGGAKGDTAALDALAGGQHSGPVDAIAAAEARDDVDAEDALASLASGEAPPAPDDARAPDETDGYLDGPGVDFAAGESIHVDPERIKAGREERKRLSKQADDLSFKRTMVPLLLAVGVLLLVISGLTASMTAGVDDTVALDDMTALEKYGSVLVWAGLPLGIVLVGGAVMFHMEIRRVEEIRRAVAAAEAATAAANEAAADPDPGPDDEPPLD